MRKKITILGAGAWGQAITNLLCDINNHDYEITLWCHETMVITDISSLLDEAMQRSRGLSRLKITQDLTSALQDCDFCLIAIPVKYLRAILVEIKNILVPIQLSKQLSKLSKLTDIKFVLLSKGIEQHSCLFSSEIAQTVLGATTKIAVLSGPSFAHELLLKQPTAVVVAGVDLELAQAIKNLFININYFQVQLSQDILGVQICAAYKNILALGVGLLHGAGYRENTRAAFLTRGLQETKLLVCSYRRVYSESDDGMDVTDTTVYGLAGLGDLILTACSTKSRNFQVGAKLGAGIKLTEIISSPALANCEALNTLASINLLAHKLNLDLPIAQTIYQIVYAGESVDQLLPRFR